MPPSLFDRPLSRDRLVLSAAAVVLVLTATDAVRHGDDAQRAGGVLAGAAATCCLGALVLLAAAVVRRVLRDGQHPPAPSRTRRAPRSSTWSAGAALRTDLGPSVLAGSRRSARPAAGRRWGAAPVRPPELHLQLDEHTTVAGVPVELTWQAPGADWVRIDGGDPLPASGSARVHLAASAEIVVTAGGAGGTRTARTGLVRVLPVPLITSVRVPEPGPVRLSAHVDVAVRPGEAVTARLDAVLAGQERLRRAQPALPPLVLPPSPALAAAVAGVGRLAEGLRRAPSTPGASR